MMDGHYAAGGHWVAGGGRGVRFVEPRDLAAMLTTMRFVSKEVWLRRHKRHKQMIDNCVYDMACGYDSCYSPSVIYAASIISENTRYIGKCP